MSYLQQHGEDLKNRPKYTKLLRKWSLEAEKLNCSPETTTLSEVGCLLAINWENISIGIKIGSTVTSAKM